MGIKWLYTLRTKIFTFFILLKAQSTLFSYQNYFPETESSEQKNTEKM